MSRRSTSRYAACGIVCVMLGIQACAGSADRTASTGTAAKRTGHRILKKFPIPSGTQETWDYITVDEAGRRLFVTQESQVHVLHADTGEYLGKIPAKGAHTAILVPEFRHGFITNGVSGTVTMFDLDSLKELKEVPAGELTDAATYEPVTKRVFAMSTVSATSTAVNAADGEVAGNISLEGRPQQTAPDGAGHVFVNMRDKAEVARIDAQKLAIDRRFPIPGCDQPTSIDIDRKYQRMFIGCRDLMLYVMDVNDGRVITQLPIGDNVDWTSFDPETGLIFTSSEDGLLTVMQQDGPDSYRVVETVETQAGSKTMVLDSKTHRLYLPYGEVVKLPPTLQKRTGGKVDRSGVRRSVTPNSFGVFVVGTE